NAQGGQQGGQQGGRRSYQPSEGFQGMDDPPAQPESDEAEPRGPGFGEQPEARDIPIAAAPPEA
ncbi:MAG: hypothetical protein ACJ8AW_30790, partial [Rhodopila sp.]